MTYDADDERRAELADFESLLFSRGDGIWLWEVPDGAARVCVQERRVAWVHCPAVGIYLSDRLADALDLPLADLRDHIVQCRASGRKLAEYLADTGVMSHATLRSVLGVHNAEHFAALMLEDWDDPADFEPTCDRYDRAFTFSLDELLAFEDALLDDPRLAPEVTSAYLDRVMEVNGVLGAALVDAKRRFCVGARGADRTAMETHALASLELVHIASNLGAFSSTLAVDITIGRRCELLRRVRGLDQLVLVVIDLDQTSHALASHTLGGLSA